MDPFLLEIPFEANKMLPGNVQLLLSDNRVFGIAHSVLNKVDPKRQREVGWLWERVEPDAFPSPRIPQPRIIIKHRLLDKPMTRHSNTIP